MRSSDTFRCFVFLLTCIGTAHAIAKPNIVLILVDDMGYADLGCYGSKAIETPNLDAMAERGMRFTEHYAGCTVCAPTRSTLMTGYHMGHAYMRSNSGGVPIRKEEITIAEMLREAGYRTGGFGKWGLGDIGTEGAPEKQGFDEFFGYYHQLHAHNYLPTYLVRNGKKIELPGNIDAVKQGGRPGPFPRIDQQTGRTRQFSHDLIFYEMKEFLGDAAASGEPFFCYAPWTLPHPDYSIAKDDPAWGRYKSEPWSMQARVHAAFVGIVDRHVGETLELLEELGIADNTLVLFTSDNGAAQRFEGATNSSGPLRGFKRDLHEGGIRTPLIAIWPDKIQPGSVSDLLAYSPDMMPTFAEVAGVSAPKGIDGLSIVPTLLGKGEQTKHAYLYWEFSKYNWEKRQYVPGGLQQAVRMGSWKAVKTGKEEPLLLYNLAEDTGERENLADRHPDRAAEMLRLMEQARTPMVPQSEPKMPPGQQYR